MAFSLLSHTGAGNASSGVTTAAIDTTGATLIIVHVSSYAGSGEPTLSDSAGNTFTGLTEQATAQLRSRLFYVVSPTTSGTHTFTLSGANTFPSLEVSAWSGVDTADPFDVQNGATATSASTLSTGSVTPSNNNSLVITGFNPDEGHGAMAINSGFTITDTVNLVASTYFGGSMAYLIQAFAAAVNPQWDAVNSVANLAATIAVFNAAATVANDTLLLLGAA